MIKPETIYDTAYELTKKAAVIIPSDVKNRIKEMYDSETNPRSKYVLAKILENYNKAETEERPMCSDTGLPRFYVKCGNEVPIQGGMIMLEEMIRKATADATRDIPLRPNRVHPLTRKDNNNNIGIHAPTVDYSFEPNADWLDLITVHKGGLFGSDYRMLFPADGIDGIKKFYLDTISEFFRRGMTCQPSTIGIGIGGTKDVCVKLAKEAACLRIIGDRNPDDDIARLEKELVELSNSTGFGPMGLTGNSSVLDVHIEVAYAHTGGMPVSIHQFCFAQRRAAARIFSDDSVEYREDPQWFTDYYRRETTGGGVK
ncbi:MAG TPA: fumarate hydratase [Clostridia bacterium]